MRAVLRKIWAWCAKVVAPTAAIFGLWMVAMVLICLLCGYLAEQTTNENDEMKVFRWLVKLVIAVTVLCLVAILVRAGWIAMLIAAAMMVAIIVIVYHAVD